MTRIARSTLTLAVFFFFDKILALVRQRVINSSFDLDTLDIFYVANNIPDLLSVLISAGALSVAFIPVLTEYLETKGQKDTWDLFSRILNMAFLFTGVVALMIAVFATPLVANVIAPGFRDDPVKLSLTVQLMRLDLISIMIFSISGLVMASLQANQHFLLPAMAPALFNIGQIAGVLIFARRFDMGIHGLVYGVILGASLHLAIQIPGLFRYRFRWSPAINLRHPGVQQVLRLFGPRIVTVFFIQLFFIIRDNLASGMDAGAVTALANGWFIMQVPETLLGTTVAIVLLPTLAGRFARGDEAAFRETVNKAIRVLIAFTIPSAALLAVSVEYFVGILGFEGETIQLVAWATRGYLLGMTGHALLEITSRSFYARQDARTPLFAAALNAAAYFVLAIVLSGLLGHVGIALANSIAFTSEAILLIWLLNRRLPGLIRLEGTLLRTVAVSALGALIAFLLLTFVPSPLPDLVNGVLAVGVGGLVILPFIWPEVKLMLRLGEDGEQIST